MIFKRQGDGDTISLYTNDGGPTGLQESVRWHQDVGKGTGLLTTHTLKGDSTAANIVTVTQQDMLGRTVSNKVGNATTTYTYDMLNMNMTGWETE